jgi:hypothetical protein
MAELDIRGRLEIFHNMAVRQTGLVSKSLAVPPTKGAKEMTVYTFEQDAQGLLNRITNATNLNDHANLIDELKERYYANSKALQLMAESNERWAKQDNQRKAAVEAFIERELENDPDALKNENLRELAETFDIELTRDVEISVKIEYTVWATVDRYVSDDAINDQLTIDREPEFRLGVASSLSQNQEDFTVKIDTL